MPPAAHDVGLAAAVGELQPVRAAVAELVARGEPLADDRPPDPAAGWPRTASRRRRTPPGPASARPSRPRPPSSSRRRCSGSRVRSRPSRRSTSKTRKVTGVDWPPGAQRTVGACARASARPGRRSEGRPSASATTSPSSSRSRTGQVVQLGEGRRVTSFSLRLVSRTRVAVAAHVEVGEHPHAVPLDLVGPLRDPSGTWLPRVASIGRMGPSLRTTACAGRPAAP